MTREADILTEAQKAVSVLVDQYRQDQALIAKLERLKSQRLIMAAKISKTDGVALRDILRNTDQYPDIMHSRAAEADVQAKQQLLWDDMFYDTPVIWLMYKYQAYKGAQNEIATMRDLKKHCEPQGYICTKRFHFLRTYLLHNHDLDIATLPDDMLLPAFYESDALLRLVDDAEFMQTWRGHEYCRVDGKVAKWQSYAIR